MQRLLFAALLLGLAGCFHPWMPVLRGMQADKVVAEVSGDEDDYNSKRPPTVSPSESNKWVLFVYEPKDVPKTHAAFAGFTDDCFFQTIQYEGADDDAPKPYHAAICAYERTPKPPDEE